MNKKLTNKQFRETFYIGHLEILGCFSFLFKEINKIFYNNKLKKPKFYLYVCYEPLNKDTIIGVFSSESNQINIKIDQLECWNGGWFESLFITFAHEVAHLVQYQLYNKANHSLQFWKIHREVYEYVLCMIHQIGIEEKLNDRIKQALKLK